MFRGNILDYMVTKIAIATVLVYVVLMNFSAYQVYFVLNPKLVVHYKFLWQPLTYLFVHGNFWHLIINMLVLMMFGMQVEDIFGARKFLFYYFFCGIGAGLVILLIGAVLMAQGMPVYSTVGASGAVFAVIVAFAFLYPHAQILLFFVIPVPARFLPLIYIVYDLYSYSYSTANISHTGHLGGVIFALLFFVIWGDREAPGFLSSLKQNVQKQVGEQKEKAVQSAKSRIKQDIVEKVKASGNLDVLNEDEHQLVQYCEIMYDEDSAILQHPDKGEDLSDHDFITLVRRYTTS